ncbi:DUF362 domain-containing protein [Candidatus Poribacteria bacterium]
MHDFSGPPKHRRARGSRYNLLIVTFIALALAFVLYGTVYKLWSPPTPPQGHTWELPTLKLRYVYLLLMMDYIFALWVAWHTPTTRVIGLAILGAAAGLGTELTAHYSGMWVYGNVHMVGGILLYSMTAITLFGMVYLVSLFLSRLPLMKTTGWFNVILVVLVFLVLYATANSDYMKLIRQHHYVEFYYWLLFSLAVTVAYTMRLSTLLSALIAAPLLAIGGLYAGGSHGQIWTFLPFPDDPVSAFPPTFLFLAIWPLECLAEYGFSASIADGLTYLFKARKQERMEELMPPDERLENIPFYGYNPSQDSFFSFLMRIGRRGLVKMFCRSPEKGEVITALAGAALITSATLECKNGYFDEFGRFGQLEVWQAAIIAAFFGVAILVSRRMFWKRVAGFALIGITVGYGLLAGLRLALEKFSEESPYFVEISWGFYVFLVFIVIYGVAHLATRFFAHISLKVRGGKPIPSFMKNRGNTRGAIAISLVILALFIVALVVIQPDFLKGKGSDPNPALFLFLFGISLTFVIWWLFPQILFIRSVIHIIVAAVVSAIALYPVLSKNIDIFSWSFALYIATMTVGYLVSYTASAHVAGEYLAKRISMTYWRKPKARAARAFKVVFHDTPHEKGLHREEIRGELHTYPPILSGVNVTSAKVDQTEMSTRDTVRQALDGLVGCWASPDGTGELVDSVSEAVKGKKVFIKPNLVGPFASPYVTEPGLVADVARYCMDAGAKEVVIGDIAISNVSSRMATVDTGFKDFWESIKGVRVLVLDETPFKLVNLLDHADNAVKGVVLDRFYEPAVLLEKDTFYIDIPKMKTHLQSSVTLGIKNSHGLCSEADRGLYHQRISQKVVDITKTWIPDLTIVDGYDALEGIGPWPGDLVPLRVLVASNDVVLADLVACQLMQKEELEPNFSRDVDFSKKFVKSTWLGYKQRLGILDIEKVKRTIGSKRDTVDLKRFNEFIEKHSRDFARPEFRDEGLIKNIGRRFNKEPNLNEPIPDWDPNRKEWGKWDPDTEFLPLDGRDPVVPYKGPLKPVATWGPTDLVADEWRYPDFGSSVMLSGIFGILKCLLERHFSRELDILDGFAVVYGPLRKPLECEGALLFGEGAISTEYMVFAPKIYQLSGHGRPPNRYSQPFDRMGEELRGELMGFSTEAINFARGWYW